MAVDIRPVGILVQHGKVVPLELQSILKSALDYYVYNWKGLPRILSRLLSSMVAESRNSGHLNVARRNFQVEEQYGLIAAQPLTGSITWEEM